MKPKEIIAKELKLKISEVSVRHGRGTARHWLDVTTPEKVPYEVQDKIEKQLLKLNLCSTYCADDGFNVDSPCVAWHVK